MKDLYYKRSVESHKLLKEKILQAISTTPSLYNRTLIENHLTDYHVSTELKRNYEHLVMPAVIEHTNTFKNYYNFGGIQLVSMWFQQYTVGGFHDWHVHPSCHFTNVYFIELPDNSLTTQIKNPFDNHNILNVTVAEGDILTFPSFFYHSAPVVDVGVKTIISFNTNII
jgi:hypothetical protein